MCGGIDDGHTWGDQDQAQVKTGYCPRCGHEIDCRACARFRDEVARDREKIRIYNEDRRKREEERG